MKLSLWFLISLILLSGLLAAQTIYEEPRHEGKSAFAIIVDQKTWDEAKKEIRQYRDAIEKEGLSVWIAADFWKNPESIKNTIQAINQASPRLEGVVFIGKIPVPMLRDAQHLTSAFKMDQTRYPMIRSSVPSDRFYEDFDLQFDFICQDSAHPLLFYYSLSSQSPQYIEKELYSGRIYPGGSDAESIASIKGYLQKVIAYKGKKEALNRALFIAGQGYHSEALSAWEGELLSLYDQFPQFYQPNGGLNYYYHSMTQNLKRIILKELENDKYDLAVFHAHGSPENQFLLGEPVVSAINEHVMEVKRLLRNRLRSLRDKEKDIELEKNRLMDQLEIPADWFNGAFDDSIFISDSLYAYNRDIYLKDIREIKPNPRMIIFDECFNGRFIEDSGYIAGAYIYNDGNSLAGIANTVNVLQDIWANEGVGMLSHGLRIGQWHKTRAYLESHIIGDPTFCFQSDDRLPIIERFLNNQIHPEEIEKMIKSDYPIERALAAKSLLNLHGEKAISRLVLWYFSEKSGIVRLQIMKLLARTRSTAFEEILAQTLDDPYEMIRRKSVVWMGDIGYNEYIPLLIRAATVDISERVRFNARNALDRFFPRDVINCADSLKQIPIYWSDQLNNHYRFRENTNKSDDYFILEYQAILNDSLSAKKRLNSIRSFRNNRVHGFVEGFIDFAKNPKIEEEFRIATVEMLGWFTFSRQRGPIVSLCRELIQSPNTPAALKQEAQKTIKRITYGVNDPLTP